MNPPDSLQREGLPFVETSVAHRICRVADLALEMGTNAAVVGAPGVGKSAALLAYARTRNYRRTHVITVTQVMCKSMRHLLLALRELEPEYCTDDIYRLERQFLKYDYYQDIFLIDEAQNLPLSHLRQLLHLSVEDGGPLTFVFCGNNEVLKRVNTDQGAFAQISRRVSFREEIDAITDDDSDLLASAYGAEGMDAFRIMRQVAARHHAGGVVKVLRLARKLTNTSTVSAEDIRSALDVLPQYRPADNEGARRKTKTATYRIDP